MLLTGTESAKVPHQGEQERARLRSLGRYEAGNAHECPLGLPEVWQALARLGNARRNNRRGRRRSEAPPCLGILGDTPSGRKRPGGTKWLLRTCTKRPRRWSPRGRAFSRPTSRTARSRSASTRSTPNRQRRTAAPTATSSSR